MTTDIRQLEPKAVWRYFHALTQTPRPSKHEEAVQALVMRFGAGLGLETTRDDLGNVMIRKPPTAGMEDRAGVILQSHLDMVPQANKDTKHDFTKDPIDARVDGDWVVANGTTLGADNGIGVAAIMAVLASTDVEHGPLEGLFTADEESGMTGASGLAPGALQGDILLNLDTEDTGTLCIGCAGGMNALFTFDASLEATPADGVAHRLAVTGLRGGHSGMEIHLGRGNANTILFRYLREHAAPLGIRLAAIDGGGLRNAIPREAFATIVTPSDTTDALAQSVDRFEKTVQHELGAADPNIKIAIARADAPARVITVEAQGRIIEAIVECPDGVVRMHPEIPDLVDTSNNLATVKLEGDTVTVHCMLRSSSDDAKRELADAMTRLFERAGASAERSGAYPGWTPNTKSVILEVMTRVHERLFGHAPKVEAVHAGLECGLLGATYPHWDMISFGPTIRSPHSPDERVEISTVKDFYIWLRETLRCIPVNLPSASLRVESPP